MVRQLCNLPLYIKIMSGGVDIEMLTLQCCREPITFSDTPITVKYNK